MTMTTTPADTSELVAPLEGPESLDPAETDAPWYMATPKAMADVVMTSYRHCLVTHGIRMTKVGLVDSHAAGLAAPALVGLPAQPADDALRIAREIVADSYAQAMEEFGLWPWVRSAVEARVLTEVEETITEHVRLRAEGPSRSVGGPSGDKNTKPGEKPAGQVKGEAADNGAKLPAEDGTTAEGAAAEGAAGEDPSGG